MRVWLTMIGLLVALGVVGLMAKQQMKALPHKAPAVSAASPDAPSNGAPATPATPQQVQDDFRRQLDDAVQSRTMPNDEK